MFRDSSRTPYWQIGAAMVILGAVLCAGVFLGMYERIEPVDTPVVAPHPQSDAALDHLATAGARAGKNGVPLLKGEILRMQKPAPAKLPHLVAKAHSPGSGPYASAKPHSIPGGPNKAELLDNVKRATVYLRVVSADGRTWEGTGFFAVEPGVVITNAHVVGVGQPGAASPKQIDAVLFSGMAEERVCAGRILAVDPLTDLAVLRIDGADLPPPLAVLSAQRLRELERVYVFGFPFGQSLGKHITVSESSVSSLRLDAAGKLDKVQVNGGMHPGNSGGPVVDTGGAVVGVAVSGIHGTQINFAVPGEFVHALLNGRLAGHIVGMPYRDGNQVRIPYEMVFLDPLGRIRQPQVEYWCGAPRTPASKDAAGASKPQKLALTYENGRARGELRLNQAEPGKSLWLRAGFVAGGEQRWAQDQAHPLLPPLVRRPVRLQMARAPTRQQLHLLSTARLHQAIEGAAKTLVTHMDVQMVEKIQPQAKDSLVHIEYGPAKVAIEANGKPAPPNQRLRDTIDQVPALVFELYQDQAGVLRPYRLNRTRVPPELRDDVSDVHEQIVNALLAVNLSLPNREVKARETWKSLLTLPGAADKKADLAVAELVCTYEGVLTRNGRSEALITMAGDIRAADALTKPYRGRAEGQAMLDVASGQFVDIAVTMFLDMEPTLVEGRPVRTSGTLDVRLHRDIGAKAGP